MSDANQDARQEPPRRPLELQQIADSYNAVGSLLAENERQQEVIDGLRSQIESLERSTAILENENRNLRHQMSAERRSRDHYMRAFTALSAQLEGIGATLLKAVESARVHSYGDQPALPAGRPDPSDPARLRFLRPQQPQSTGDVPVGQLQRIIGGVATGLGLRGEGSEE